MLDSDRSNKRTAKLKEASAKKKQQALDKTRKAIDKLVENKQKITVRSVAREAGVSVSYLYKYPEISYKIQSLRDAQKYENNACKKMIDKNNNILEQREDIKDKLVEENTYLNAYIKSLEGKKKSVSEIENENIKLQIENEKLKQELEFTKQQLAETRDFILSQGYDETQDKIELETRERVVKQIT